MEKLFDDSLLIQKERPTKITAKQEEQMHANFAKEILENQYCQDDEESIIEDLRELSWNDSGFEKAKELESYGFCKYKFEGDFIDWLDNMSYDRDQILNENVKLWVKAHNPQPKLEKGDMLKVVESLSYTPDLRKEAVIYITGINLETANYYVYNNPDHNGGYVLAFEKVESGCEILKN